MFFFCLRVGFNFAVLEYCLNMKGIQCRFSLHNIEFLLIVVVFNIEFTCRMVYHLVQLNDIDAVEKEKRMILNAQNEITMQKKSRMK